MARTRCAIVIVDVEQGRVSYDLYEVHCLDHKAHGIVVDHEPAEAVIERLDAYFGGHAIVARHIPHAIAGAVIPVGVSARRLRGPCGEVALDHGAIIAQRHVHMNPSEVLSLGVHDHDVLHVDTDEANAAGLGQDATVTFTGIERRGG